MSTKIIVFNIVQKSTGKAYVTRTNHKPDAVFAEYQRLAKRPDKRGHQRPLVQAMLNDPGPDAFYIADEVPFDTVEAAQKEVNDRVRRLGTGDSLKGFNTKATAVSIVAPRGPSIMNRGVDDQLDKALDDLVNGT